MNDDEELKNMSPEQIADLQRQNCIFCKIIAGEIPSKKVYDDNHFIGILDINPATDGHVLLLPKQHVQIMPQMNGNQISGLGSACRHVSEKMIKAFKCEGTSIFMANGVVAGQRAPHFIIHIIPRKEDDGINLNPELSEIDTSAFISTKQKILSAIGAKQQAAGQASSQTSTKTSTRTASSGVKEYAKGKSAAGEFGQKSGNATQKTAPSAASKLADEKKKKKKIDADFVDIVYSKGEGNPHSFDSADRQQREEIRQNEDKSKGAAHNDEEWVEEEREREEVTQESSNDTQNVDDEARDKEDDSSENGSEEENEEEEKDKQEEQNDAGSGKIDFDKLARLFK